MKRPLVSLVVSLLAVAGASCSRSAEIAPGTVIEALDERGGRVSLRLEGARLDPLDPGQQRQLYRFSARTPAGEWAPYCGADARGSIEALVVEGSWDIETGKRRDSGGMTIACVSGAIAKCVRFGYQTSGLAGETPMSDLHQACMRMVRADYCGDGAAHTVDGTFIHIYDRAQIQRPDADRPVEFEAGWGPDGATYLAATRWGEALDDIVARCPERLRGRVAVAGQQLTGAQLLARDPATLIISEHASRVEDRSRLPGPAPAAPR